MFLKRNLLYDRSPKIVRAGTILSYEYTMGGINFTNRSIGSEFPPTIRNKVSGRYIIII